jgi:prepilin-type N-terminal cleavage/methylation domain-containing protein
MIEAIATMDIGEFLLLLAGLCILAGCVGVGIAMWLENRITEKHLRNIRETTDRMREVMKNRGYTFIEVLIVISIICILIAVALPAYNDYLEANTVNADQLKEPSYQYVICKDSTGEIHQRRGTRFTVEGSTVLVWDRREVVGTFINMDCWTEDQTIEAEEKTYGWPD